jgi:hypothetical protein
VEIDRWLVRAKVRANNRSILEENGFFEYLKTAEQVNLADEWYEFAKKIPLGGYT